MGVWLCDACYASIQPLPEPICPRCGRPGSSPAICATCRTEPPSLDGIRSVGLHEGALRQAIHHLKYRRRRELADPLGRMLFDYWRCADLAADLVIPVPLHDSRMKERGFNQASLLARALTDRAQLPLDETHLRRIRATPPQVGLGAAQRKANVRDAFEWQGESLSGSSVLVIDDVCTTGATLEACAAALRRADAGMVWALTLARPWGLTDGSDNSA
jgi:ComF family protein